MAGLSEGNIRVIHASYQAAQRMSRQEASPRTDGLPICVHTRFIGFISARDDGQPAIVWNRVTNSPPLAYT